MLGFWLALWRVESAEGGRNLTQEVNLMFWLALWRVESAEGGRNLTQEGDA